MLDSRGEGVGHLCCHSNLASALRSVSVGFADEAFALLSEALGVGWMIHRAKIPNLIVMVCCAYEDQVFVVWSCYGWQRL